MKNDKYSLILSIVNKGNTDLVMQAANKAGGRGGTITGARGTSNPKLAQFYGFAFQPEKELVFIVVKNKVKDQVMKQITEDAGIKTKGQGIVLSLPISDAIGLVDDEGNLKGVEENSTDTGSDDTKQ